MDIRKEIYATCFDPVQVKIYNPVTRMEEMRDVPCGKCYHCRITKVNEWVTRMVLETMYNKYCYFVTLTYGIRAEHTDVFAETYPRWSTINQNGVYQNTPLVLRKDHLQKFFKRLRKNTGIKFKYFACGEYGHQYGRPHYHVIFWSDEPFSKMDIYRAWSTTDVYGRRVVIGNIDFNDLMQNGTIKTRHSFKYVCKYLQKQSFSFNQLPTKDLHNHLKIMLYDYQSYVESTPKQAIESVDEKYRKRFSPFMLCSKSPSIGAGYLYDHIDRFSEKDFRLFGISDKSLIFPRYYVRKTKEYLCPFKCISKVTAKPNSSCGIEGLASVLVAVQNCIDFNEGFLSHSPLLWIDTRNRCVHFSDRYFGEHARMPWRFFNFYDCNSREYYLFAGNRYIRMQKRKGAIVLKGTCTVDSVLERLYHTYNLLLEKLLVPFEDSRVDREREFMQCVHGEFGTKEKYDTYRKEHIDMLLSTIDTKQNRYLVTKNKF